MSSFDRDKWNAKYAAEIPPREPSAVLLGLADLLPKSGRALDLAGGGGRHSIWLAQRGLDVTLADVSTVGMAIARQRAAEAGATIQTVEADLDDGEFPAGPWELIVSVCYLRRSLYDLFPSVLAPGGTLAVVQPTQRNLERHAKPPTDYLLNDGELPGLLKGLEVVYYEEGWQADGRHDAVIVGRASGLP
jgi:cyclopropane fatty-acyl-phospholipid synthase-like methyltransferase